MINARLFFFCCFCVHYYNNYTCVVCFNKKIKYCPIIKMHIIMNCYRDVLQEPRLKKVCTHSSKDSTIIMTLVLPQDRIQ